MKGTIRVHVNNAGSGTKVSLFIYQTVASGMTSPEYTNSEGDAYFDVDTDQYAQAEVYVSGQLARKRGSLEDVIYV